MINWCPIGRNANDNDRQRFEEFDKTDNSFRMNEIKGFEKFLAKTNRLDRLTIKLGGETSFDIYPKGWDKRLHFNILKITSVGLLEIVAEKMETIKQFMKN